MIGAHARSTASEGRVRTAIAQALEADDIRTVTDEPGALALETGSVATVLLAGWLSREAKLPVRITVDLVAADEGGTEVLVGVASRGPAAFFWGGLLGVRKQKRAEQLWLERVLSAIPGRVPD